MMQTREIKYVKLIVFFISQFFYSQTIVSFYDVTEYKDEDKDYILYRDQKYTGKYFLNSDTVKIITSVKNGIIYNIEESGPNYKSVTSLEKDRKYKKVYDRVGHLILEGLLVNDEKQGKWKNYYSNGTVKNIKFYDEDKKIGEWKYYDSEGTVLKTIIFKNELPYPELKEMNDNVLKLETLVLKYENCRQILSKISSETHDDNCDFVYYHNNSRYTGYAISENKAMYFIEYGKATFFKMFMNNEVSEYAEVNDDLEKNGEYLKFGLSGSIKIRGNYKKNHKSGDWLEYYDSGKIESKKRYDDDKPREWWFYYSESGDNIKIEIYSNGELETIGKPVYETRNSKYFDSKTVFFDAKTNKPLYQKKERHFIKNGYVYPLEYKEL